MPSDREMKTSQLQKAMVVNLSMDLKKENELSIITIHVFRWTQNKQKTENVCKTTGIIL